MRGKLDNSNKLARKQPDSHCPVYPSEDRPELPKEAIREAVINTFAHCNYRSTANVQVYLFSDRPEIVSPGGLQVDMTEADLGIKSVPRTYCCSIFDIE